MKRSKVQNYKAYKVKKKSKKGESQAKDRQKDRTKDGRKEGQKDQLLEVAKKINDPSGKVLRENC